MNRNTGLETELIIRGRLTQRHKGKTRVSRCELICGELLSRAFELQKDGKKTAQRGIGNTVLTCHKTRVERLLVKMANPGDLQ